MPPRHCERGAACNAPANQPRKREKKEERNQAMDAPSCGAQKVDNTERRRKKKQTTRTLTEDARHETPVNVRMSQTPERMRSRWLPPRTLYRVRPTLPSKLAGGRQRRWLFKDISIGRYATRVRKKKTGRALTYECSFIMLRGIDAGATIYGRSLEKRTGACLEVNMGNSRKILVHRIFITTSSYLDATSTVELTQSDDQTFPDVNVNKNCEGARHKKGPPWFDIIAAWRVRSEHPFIADGGEERGTQQRCAATQKSSPVHAGVSNHWPAHQGVIREGPPQGRGTEQSRGCGREWCAMETNQMDALPSAIYVKGGKKRVGRYQCCHRPGRTRSDKHVHRSITNLRSLGVKGRGYARQELVLMSVDVKAINMIN
ncbi:hypothetical protein C8J57DRAFT_1260847 [Mycena rebaudengoi]|nr:hypothetical protein C8J57DRAFT_1260847 [Mycena rebaudengoi]